MLGEWASINCRALLLFGAIMTSFSHIEGLKISNTKILLINNANLSCIFHMICIPVKKDLVFQIVIQCLTHQRYLDNPSV